MNKDQLARTARALVTPGRGILAADESGGTIAKRFAAVGIGSTEETRRDYRELLFRSREALRRYISGVILYDETIRQSASDGTALVKLIRHLPEGITELMCHPGFLRAELRAARTRLKESRQRELEALTSPSARQALEEAGVRLVNYRSLRRDLS